MRRVYTLLLWLALPVVSLTVLWRGLRERAYWEGWRERFGGARVPHQCSVLMVDPGDSVGVAPGPLWVHAASVGEVSAAAPLVDALLQGYPERKIYVTSTTPAGRARARQLFGTRVSAYYAPYDLPLFLRRAMASFDPALCIVVETELWPNLFHECARDGVPMLLASARMSARTARFYSRFPSLLGPALARNVEVGAQSEADARRFLELGAPPDRVRVTGNIKFEREPPPGVMERGAALRARLAPGRPLWVGGSTHEPEEQYLLEAQAALGDLPEGAPLLVLAPRHRLRFDAVAALLRARGLRWARRSELESAPDQGAGPGQQGAALQVLLLDTLGELQDFYAAADVVFVGGSMTPVGGHNLLEGAQLGLPLLAGVHQFNAPDIARELGRVHALTLVADPEALADELRGLLEDPAARRAAGEAGRAVVLANRGALQKLMSLVAESLARQRGT